MFNYTAPKIIAEIGCNHKGDIEIAYDLIRLAKECGADIAKFQKRSNKELLTPEQYSAPHPNPENSYGNTYGEHREFLEFDVNQHQLLKSYCEKLGIEYSTSVWDVSSAQEMTSLNPSFLKVPSACNNHFEMLEVLRDVFKGEVHISLGMTTVNEEEKIINFFSQNGQNDRLVIYSCTSGYPVPFKDVCLQEINRLYKLYSGTVKSIAFSGHHLGIAIDVAAYTLGAKFIERHFTKDRSWKGTDHSASLEPQGLSKLVRNLHATHESLSYKNSEILDIEKVQRDKLKFRKT
ncbi:MAG: N-acetylneuraminate synthase [Candidatus Marinimicrobia bacterium]|nr:N-acetylneuraminate synthase [Candidatus Neomarinimicrobiota bacterium]|tara:strand:+ start:4952 stop:5824 length:873 start_codon:yes stop_codon:yes gene_type:complete